MSDNKWLEDGDVDEKDERYMLGQDGENQTPDEEAIEEDPVSYLILSTFLLQLWIFFTKTGRQFSQN